MTAKRNADQNVNVTECKLKHLLTPVTNMTYPYMDITSWRNTICLTAAFGRGGGGGGGGGEHKTCYGIH